MTVGIVGAGQLGRMMALAGYPLGLDFLFLDPAEQPPAAQLAPVLKSAFTDDDALREPRRALRGRDHRLGKRLGRGVAQTRARRPA